MAPWRRAAMPDSGADDLDYAPERGMVQASSSAIAF